MQNKTKKAQQEIMGFVLIIVLVAIIALIFLGFALRKPSTTKIQENQDTSNFLQAALQVTSSCKLYSGQYGTMQDAVKACYKGEVCGESNLTACDILNSTFREILESEFLSEKPVRLYDMRIYLDKTNQDILRISKGNSTAQLSCYSAQEAVYVSEGNLLIELKLCYG